MLSVEFLRVALVLAHLVAFAVAMFLVLREDLRLLFSRRLNLEELEATAHSVSRALIGLFVTGAAVVFVDTGFDPAVMAETPKLLAKFTVVAVLTVNGLALHYLIFPRLKRKTAAQTRTLSVFAAALGAISSVSWIYATFLGIAKPLTVSFGYEGFMALYGAALGGGVTIAVLILSQHVHQLILAEHRFEPFDRLFQPRASGGRDMGIPIGQPVRQTVDIRATGGKKASSNRNP